MWYGAAMAKVGAKKGPGARKGRPRNREQAAAALPDPRAMLAGFHRKQVASDALMRALAQHDGWIAPALLLAQAYGWKSFSNVIMFGEETRLSSDNVWFFTDMAAGMCALEAGAAVGACEGGLFGADLLAGLDPVWGALLINPGSPTEESLVIQGDAIPWAVRWGRAVSIEAAMTRAGAADYARLVERVRAFDGYVLLQYVPAGELATLESRDGDFLVAFTAPDGIEPFLRMVGGEPDDHQAMVVDGTELCLSALERELHGVVLNPFGPGPECTVHSSFAADVAGLAGG